MGKHALPARSLVHTDGTNSITTTSDTEGTHLKAETPESNPVLILVGVHNHIYQYEQNYI